MKRILLFFLLATLCFSLVSCTLDEAPTKERTEADTEQTVAESKVETFGLNDTAAFKNLKFTAMTIEENTGEDFFQPEVGNVFVGIKFTIENISNENQNVSTLMLFEGYCDDIKCSYSISAACVFDEGTLDGEIAPGKKLVGWYALEVPENWASIELDVASDRLSNKSARFVFEK